MKSWFTAFRAIVYLKRIAEALERIAAYTDTQMPTLPKRSKKVFDPTGEVFKPSVSDFNAGYRERHPESEYTNG